MSEGRGPILPYLVDWLCELQPTDRSDLHEVWAVDRARTLAQDYKKYAAMDNASARQLASEAADRLAQLLWPEGTEASSKAAARRGQAWRKAK